MNTITLVALIAPSVIVAITFHEAAHGFVAFRLGDQTAFKRGRLTLNPLKHIDPVGTILLPAALLLMNVGFVFGYAKPVPVNPDALGNPRRDMVLVAAAGPAMNLLLAFVSFLLMFPVALLSPGTARLALFALEASVAINLTLAIFNMIPLPPLDGGKVAVGLLPDVLAKPLARIGRYGFLILIVVLFIAPVIAKRTGTHFDAFDWLVGRPVSAVMGIVDRATGNGANPSP
jgi:Zn-dependent protease